MRERSLRFTNPDLFLSDTRSVVVFLIPYAPIKSLAVHSSRLGYARVARYAWGLDYHEVIKEKLRELVADIEETCSIKSPVQFRVFTDSAPIFERALAESGKLGFIGKNSLLITPRTGSYNFIATIMWNLDVDSDVLPDVQLSNCGSCERCMTRCPTGAIVKPGVLDARLCISYLTIERKTALNSAELSMLGDWAFGCDVCQEVCPFNNAGTVANVADEFSSDKGVGPWIDILEVFALSSSREFRERFSGTPLIRAGRECLVRNCIAVAVNTGFAEGESALHKLATQDESPYVRYHAKLGIDIYGRSV
jgi:epoxyqueuosine reductase